MINLYHISKINIVIKPMNYPSNPRLQGTSVSKSSKKFLQVLQATRSPIQNSTPNSKKKINLDCQQKTLIFPDRSQHANTSIDKSQLAKLMAFMRQQIQKGAEFYNKKMSSVLKQQAKEINSLKTQLINNNKILIEKEAMIVQLKNHNKQSPKKKLSVTTHPVMRQEHYNQQLRELSGRIDEIEQQLTRSTAKVREKQKIQRILVDRIQYIEKMMVGAIGGKVRGCYKKIDRYINSRQRQFEKFQAKISTISSSSNQSIIDSLTPSLSNIHSQIIDLKSNIHNLKNKQFIYQNHQMNELSHQLHQLKHNVNSLDEANHNIQVAMNTSQLKRTIATRNQSHQDLTFTSKNNHKHYPQLSQQSKSQKLINPTTHQHELSASTNNIGKIYDDYEDVQSFTDRQNSESGQQLEDYDDGMDEQLEINQQRLTTIIKNMNMGFPLRVSIDQTGYLKCLNDGMYLVDENHDGFYLTEEEIQIFTEKGIIEVIYQ